MEVFCLIFVFSIFSLENVYLVEGQSNPVVQKFKEFNFIKDGVIKAAPRKLLQVQYQGKNVNPGDSLQVIDVVDQPVVSWDCKPTSAYALILCDADALGTTPDKPFLHWWVQDIPGCDTRSGHTLYTYIPPADPEALHRYLFLLWEQNELIGTNDTAVDLIVNRNIFAVPSVTRKYRRSPIAGNFILVTIQNITLPTNSDLQTTKLNDKVPL